MLIIIGFDRFRLGSQLLDFIDGAKVIVFGPVFGREVG
jgi:hypothetical protein